MSTEVGCLGLLVVVGSYFAEPEERQGLKLMSREPGHPAKSHAYTRRQCNGEPNRCPGLVPCDFHLSPGFVARVGDTELHNDPYYFAGIMKIVREQLYA